MTIERSLEIVTIAWPVASGLLNWVLQWRSAEDWVIFADTHPRLHAFVMLIRRLGLDPRDVVLWMQRLVATKRKPDDTPTGRQTPIARKSQHER